MKLYTAKGILTPQPPFDFQKSLGFIREFAPTRAEQQIGEQSLTKSLYVQGQLCGFDLKSIGMVDASKLEYTLYAAHPNRACAGNGHPRSDHFRLQSAR
jgi:DNA-3-methyladenine glycosylase II